MTASAARLWMCLDKAIAVSRRGNLIPMSRGGGVNLAIGSDLALE
jgi:hypothetical protein